jgi:transposase
MTPIDMRCSFDRLAGLVQDVLGQDTFSGHMFVFRNREESKIKILYWDRDGYAIWYKRLEKGRFALPPAAASFEVETTAFMMLLNGIDARVIRKQDRYTRKSGFADSSVSK